MLAHRCDRGADPPRARRGRDRGPRRAPAAARAGGVGRRSAAHASGHARLRRRRRERRRRRRPLARSGGARRRALHVGIERRAQRVCCTRSARSGTRRCSWRRCTGSGPTTPCSCPRRSRTSRALERHHPAGCRAVQERAHGALGSGGRARPHRARAGHVHDRPADVLRLAHGGARLLVGAGREPAAGVERRRRRHRGVRRRSERAPRLRGEAHLRLDRGAHDRDEPARATTAATPVPTTAAPSAR